MEIYELDLDKVIRRFEREMFSKDRDYEIAKSLEFELFNKDEDNVYTLQFNRDERTFSIAMLEFEENHGDFIEEVYLEIYPIEQYNRYFLINRVVRYMNKQAVSMR